MAVNKKTGIWLLLVVAVAIIVGFILTPKLGDYIEDWGVHLAHYVDDDDDDDDDKLEPEQSEPLTVRLDVDDVLGGQVGIQVKSVTSSRFTPEFKAFVSVVDLSPILDLRARFLNERMQLRIAKINEQAAREELKRLQSVAKLTGTVASKKVVYADFALQEAEAKLAALESSNRATFDEMVNSWGKEVASWAKDPESKQWRELLKRQSHLLYVTVPLQYELPDPLISIRITKGDRDIGNDKAKLVSRTPVIAQQPQGVTYLFIIANPQLYSGMRLEGWVAKSADDLQGVLVPNKAIIWHDGLPWAYVEVEPGVFERRSLESGINSGKGIFVEQAVKAGELLVTKGAQMLLSEEFKWQIMDEDDDD